MSKPNQQRAAQADDPKQSAAFIEKARELEADGDNSNADLLMHKLAKMKPRPKKDQASTRN